MNSEGKTSFNTWLFCLLCFTFDFTLVLYTHNWIDYNAMAQNNNYLCSQTPEIIESKQSQKQSEGDS